MGPAVVNIPQAGGLHSADNFHQAVAAVAVSDTTKKHTLKQLRPTGVPLGSADPISMHPVQSTISRRSARQGMLVTSLAAAVGNCARNCGKASRVLLLKPVQLQLQGRLLLSVLPYCLPSTAAFAAR